MFSGRSCSMRLFSTTRRAANIPWEDGIRNGIEETVGKTPLIRLKNISHQVDRNILVKAEFLNCGGTVKDRAALYLIKDAEERGLLKPGGTIVEGTAGNTGIGLAHIAKAKGYKCVIFMPNTQSQEKIDALRVLGADVRPVPAVPYEDAMNYNHQAKAFAEQTRNAYWTNQFDNIANARAHYETTGPEIWNQTDGKIDAFTCSIGTGGTLAGVGVYLKQQNPDIKIFCADPFGSVLYSYITHGTLEKEGVSVTEGIGQGRITDNFVEAPFDGALRVDDRKAIEMTYKLLHEEGLFVGLSSGLNVSAAVDIASTMPEGSNIVTVLCDSGSRYATRLFNKKWLEEKGLYNSVPEIYREYMV